MGEFEKSIGGSTNNEVGNKKMTRNREQRYFMRNRIPIDINHPTKGIKNVRLMIGDETEVVKMPDIRVGLTYLEGYKQEILDSNNFKIPFAALIMKNK